MSGGKRPWLAAVLGFVVVGLGHAYLRRWLRAVGWVALLYAVTALFVPEAAIEAATGRMLSGEAVDLPLEQLLGLLPALAVAVASIVDAFLLARSTGAAAEGADTEEDGTVTCPNCGRTVDREFDFCQWCSADLPEPERPAGSPGATSRAEER